MQRSRTEIRSDGVPRHARGDAPLPALEDPVAGGRRVSVSDLPVGAPLDAPLYAPGAGVPLLRAGQVFTEHHRTLIAQLHISWLVTGSPEPASGHAGAMPHALAPGTVTVVEPAEAREVQALSPFERRPEPPEIGRILRQVMHVNRRTPDPVARAVNPHNGRRAATALHAAIDTLAWSAPAAEFLVTQGLRPGFLGAAVEIGLLTAIVGSELHWSDDALCDASTCAILADVGMLLVPSKIIQKPGVLTTEERTEVERHPGLGADLLRSLPDIGDRAARVAEQHHERYDGSGYPFGLVGHDIDPVAQIVGLCQLYLAAMTGRNYRPPLGPKRAMQLVRTRAGGETEPHLAAAFVRSIDPHPPGTAVRLTTGECATVSGGTVNRPTVTICRDGITHSVALAGDVEITVIGE